MVVDEKYDDIYTFLKSANDEEEPALKILRDHGLW